MYYEESSIFMGVYLNWASKIYVSTKSRHNIMKWNYITKYYIIHYTYVKVYHSYITIYKFHLHHHPKLSKHFFSVNHYTTHSYLHERFAEKSKSFIGSIPHQEIPTLYLLLAFDTAVSRASRPPLVSSSAPRMPEASFSSL